MSLLAHSSFASGPWTFTTLLNFFKLLTWLNTFSERRNPNKLYIDKFGVSWPVKINLDTPKHNQSFINIKSALKPPDLDWIALFIRNHFYMAIKQLSEITFCAKYNHNKHTQYMYIISTSKLFSFKAAKNKELNFI